MHLGLSAMSSDTVGKTPGASTWILGLGAKNHIFLLGNSNGVWPSNCLKIHPVTVCFLLTQLA